MSVKFKEGDRIRIVTRPVTPEDRKSNRYFNHMAGLTGKVANIYGPEEIAVQIDKDTLTQTAREVHSEAIRRLRGKWIDELSEEAKSKFTDQELQFDAHYVLLVRGDDLEKL
ncbi:MAG: hypothetical protein JST40_00435 [Armatimonadetes bacterium]|nr:hypothetical protein [Armatimonadota bacterium]